MFVKVVSSMCCFEGSIFLWYRAASFLRSLFLHGKGHHRRTYSPADAHQVLKKVRVDDAPDYSFTPKYRRFGGRPVPCCVPSQAFFLSTTGAGMISSGPSG